MTVDRPIQSVEVTQPVQFTTTVSGIGKENFSYQWRHNGKDIDGETSHTFKMSSVKSTDIGSYDCVVKNGYGDCVTSTRSKLSKQ